MSAPVVTAVTIGLIVASAFFVIIEFSLLGARRQRLEADAATSRSARAALRGMNELTIMLAVAQLGITACTFALGAITKPAVDYALGPLLQSWGVPAWIAGGTSFALSLFLVTFLHLVVGEMAPKSWAIAHPERAAKLVSPLGRALAFVFRPLLVGINALANRLVAASGVEPVERAAAGGHDVETIRALVEHSAAKGALPPRLQSQIDQVIELEQLTVADLVPEGQQLVSVPAGGSMGDVQRAAAQSGHMRFPLCSADGTVAGVVHVRDTLTRQADEPATKVAREAFALPPDTPVYEALARMREQSEQLALVVEEGSALGLVTVADIVRRIRPRAVRLTEAADGS